MKKPTEKEVIGWLEDFSNFSLNTGMKKADFRDFENQYDFLKLCLLAWQEDEQTVLAAQNQRWKEEEEI